MRIARLFSGSCYCSYGIIIRQIRFTLHCKFHVFIASKSLFPSDELALLGKIMSVAIDTIRRNKKQFSTSYRLAVNKKRQNRFVTMSRNKYFLSRLQLLINHR